MDSLPAHSLVRHRRRHDTDFTLCCVLQQGVIEADLAISIYAAPEDRDRIRIAVTETGVVDWRNK